MDIDNIPADALYTGHGQHADKEPFVRVAKTDRAQVARRTTAFGVYDDRGREYGYFIAIDREAYVIDAGSHTLCPLYDLNLMLGESFVVYPQGMRDGRKFGPIPVASYKRFKTLAEAEAYADQTFARAQKRATKKAVA